MWFWEVNKWEDGKYSIGFVDREKTDYGSYKVVKSKLEKDKEYLITTVDDNSFYVSNLETEHSWDKGKITKAATCTEDGIKTYTCVTCKKNRTESIPKAGQKRQLAKKKVTQEIYTVKTAVNYLKKEKPLKSFPINGANGKRFPAQQP